MAVNKQICLFCGKEKSIHSMAKHRNEKMNGSIGFCKPCLNGIDVEDIETIQDTMRLINIPFVDDIWENAVEKGDKTIFTKYIQLIAPKKEYKTFADTILSGDSQIEMTEDESNMMVLKWGKVQNQDDYHFMELAYDNLVAIKAPSTKIEEKRYVQIVKLERNLDEALMRGEAKEIKEYNKMYAEALKEQGLDIDTKSDDENVSLGVQIKNWEKHSPVPEMDQLGDVDSIKKYINLWFFIPMKRVLGMASEEEIQQLYDGES